MYVDEVWSVDVDRQILNFEECNDIKYETGSSSAPPRLPYQNGRGYGYAES